MGSVSFTGAKSTKRQKPQCIEEKSEVFENKQYGETERHADDCRGLCFLWR